MAKNTKNAAPAAAQAPVTKAPATTAQAAPAIDLASLTPAQLAALQKQLKEKKGALNGKKDERFTIIDTMLADKNADGTFKHTTRDIFNALNAKNLVDTTVEKHDQIEIKKIQARKQFLEKKTDEKAQLVHPPGTFGYKASEGTPFGLTSIRILSWFESEANVATLTDANKEVIAKAMGFEV